MDILKTTRLAKSFGDTHAVDHVDFRVSAGEVLALIKHLAKLAKYLLDGLDVARITIDQQLVTTSTDVHIEKRFEIFDVLILYTEQRVQALGRKFEFLKIAQIVRIPLA